jgi:hypothetical protein
MANIKLENQNLIAPCGLYCGECEAFKMEDVEVVFQEKDFV